MTGFVIKLEIYRGRNASRTTIYFSKKKGKIIKFESTSVINKIIQNKKNNKVSKIYVLKWTFIKKKITYELEFLFLKKKKKEHVGFHIIIKYIQIIYGVTEYYFKPKKTYKFSLKYAISLLQIFFSVKRLIHLYLLF